MKVNKELFEDYIQRNWKPNVKRVQVVSGCNCASCQLHRQLTSEWDKNQAQAEEFERHLRENKEGQAREFQRYRNSSLADYIPQHDPNQLVRRNRKQL